jgi:uncharacterized membrane protein YfcA
MDDLARVAFVPRRFRELQDLRQVAGGTWAAVALWLFAHMATRNWGVIYLGTLLIRRLVDEPLRDYYATRFGSVAPERHGLWPQELPFALAVGSGILADVRLAGSGWPSVTVLVLAARVALALVRDLPFRPYLAIALALDVLAALYWPMGPPDLHHAAPVAVIVAIGGGIAGLLDHRLLTAVLKPRDFATMAPEVSAPGAVLHLHDD